MPTASNPSPRGSPVSLTAGGAFLSHLNPELDATKFIRIPSIVSEPEYETHGVIGDIVNDHGIDGNIRIQLGISKKPF